MFASLQHDHVDPQLSLYVDFMQDIRFMSNKVELRFLKCRFKTPSPLCTFGSHNTELSGKQTGKFLWLLIIHRCLQHLIRPEKGLNGKHSFEFNTSLQSKNDVYSNFSQILYFILLYFLLENENIQSITDGALIFHITDDDSEVFPLIHLHFKFISR